MRLTRENVPLWLTRHCQYDGLARHAARAKLVWHRSTVLRPSPMTRKMSIRLRSYGFGRTKMAVNEVAAVSRVVSRSEAPRSDPNEADAAVSQHLTSCSPCFKRYMEILGGLKRE